MVQGKRWRHYGVFSEGLGAWTPFHELSEHGLETLILGGEFGCGRGLPSSVRTVLPTRYCAQEPPGVWCLQIELVWGGAKGWRLHPASRRCCCWPAGQAQSQGARHHRGGSLWKMQDPGSAQADHSRMFMHNKIPGDGVSSRHRASEEA